jgi:hypothetical protein
MNEPSMAAHEYERAGANIDPIDIQRLLSWYFDVQHPGRAHITSRAQDDPIRVS